MKCHFNKLLKSCLMFCAGIAFSVSAIAQKMPPPIQQSALEPIKYVGSMDTDKHYYDGKVPHLMGVHTRQVFRANRMNPPEGGLTGWTYNHAPMICYWNNQYFIQYLSNIKEEHNPPGRTMIISSNDGIQWKSPRVVFPVYHLPETETAYGYIPQGMPAIMHQRMGFFVADNDRLLTIGFYSYSITPRDSPNQGNGLGFVVSEIYKDGTFGPIYFIRYNTSDGWNENNTNYPIYSRSKDKGFVDACNELLADKLMTLQWWEMDRTQNGFYNLDPGELQTKALCYYHRPDHVTVALWKYNLSALSPDNGKTWTPVVKSPSLKTCAAKVWGQKTDDGKYAVTYDHSATRRNRFPLVIISGEDGHEYDHMYCVNGEVPPIRYQGIHKPMGLQYVRGVVEGNGNPPGDQMWITYSVNKEDIWVSRIEVPLKGIEHKNVDQDFESVTIADELLDWSFYMPEWGSVTTANDPVFPENKCLLMVDEEPYDYVRVERILQKSELLEVQFDLYLENVGAAALEIEVQDRTGTRPMRLRVDEDWLMLDRGPIEKVRPVRFETGQWFHIKLELDCRNQSYDLTLNEEKVRIQVPFSEKVDHLQRIVFRTGPWRGDVRSFLVDGNPGNPGLYLEDLPGSGYRVSKGVFYIDNIKTRTRK